METKENKMQPSGMDEVRMAIYNLEQKLQRSLFDYATSDFSQTLAFCISFIPSPQKEKILESYEPELQKKVKEKLDHIDYLSNKYWNFCKKSLTYILPEEKEFLPEDFIQLEDALTKISNKEFFSLISESSPYNNWIIEKIKILRPKIFFFNSLKIYEKTEIIQTLSVNDLQNIFTFAPENIKQDFRDCISKNQMKNLEKDFSFMQKPTMQDYQETIHKINNMINDDYVYSYSDFSEGNIEETIFGEIH